MNQLRVSDNSTAHKLLLETLAGHFAWLESAHPRKAKSSAARKAKQCVMHELRLGQRAQRLAA